MIIAQWYLSLVSLVYLLGAVGLLFEPGLIASFTALLLPLILLQLISAINGWSRDNDQARKYFFLAFIGFLGFYKSLGWLLLLSSTVWSGALEVYDWLSSVAWTILLFTPWLYMRIFFRAARRRSFAF